MADKRQQELISASIDGELTAQEQADVDQLLASDPDAATLHEELRALSSTLQAMPQQRVGEDLSAKVLRLAEQEKQTTPASVQQKADPSVGSADSPWRKDTWAAMAVAAALVIMVVQTWNEESDMSSVALAPKNADREPSVMTEAPAEEAEMADALAYQEAPAGSIPADAPSPVADARVAKSEQSFGAAKGAPARSPQPASRNFKKDVAPAKPSAAIAKSGRRAQNNSLKQETTGQTARRKNGVDGLGLATGVDRSRAGNALQQLAQSSSEINPQGVLVVQVDVSREAAKAGAFDRLLASNEIVFVEEELAAAPTAPSASTPGEPAGKQPAKPQAPAQQPFAEAQTEGEADRTETTGKEDMVYVVASYDQIQKTLASLGAQRGQYLSVEVNPAPEVASQRPLAAYSRVAQGGAGAGEGAGRALPPGTAAAEPKDSADKAGGTRPTKRGEKKPDAPAVNSPLNSKIQEKSKAVAQDAETAKLARSLRSGFAQRIQGPNANARRQRSAVASQQGVAGKQRPTESSENRSLAKPQPAIQAPQSDTAQAETKVDAKQPASPAQPMRVLFVLRVVDQPLQKANAANQAPQADPGQ